MPDTNTIDTYTVQDVESPETDEYQECDYFSIIEAPIFKWNLQTKTCIRENWRYRLGYKDLSWIIEYLSKEIVTGKRQEEQSTLEGSKNLKEENTTHLNWDFKHEEIITFITDIKRLNANDQIDEGLDLLNHTFDNKLLAGDYNFCDTVLKSQEFVNLDSSILLGFLTITLPWRSDLASRSAFYNLTRSAFLQRYTEIKTARLLKGLE
jgi:hypothetical protein